MGSTGIDILGWLLAAWAMLEQDGYTADPDLTMHLILTGVIAESNMNVYAARYGVWPDISFGLAQFSVAYHWAGTRQNTQDNINFVARVTRENPHRDLYFMGVRLAGNIHQARAAAELKGNGLAQVAGNIPLAALVVYNAGHLPGHNDSYWTVYAENVNRYRAAQLTARQLLESPR